ncbi:hypothetical protein Kuja_1840 [Vibrio phage vB_VchM_Kuja]|uniref:Phage tail fibre protein N-terminal domain-containing protein n=1 Tax=Vibrio phage vB_VchM_Kuja TaxID=2686437 RepID=A0A6B9JB13_9CAUD|nr:tail collar fiber protein [Vibrio phage vB_VchM_Kuja]QGZ16176.1 hypothetical protein Kuja_1840 [Vibrio phage vB_VchM_Kuja]
MATVDENEVLLRLTQSADKLDQEVTAFKTLIDNKLTPNSTIFERFVLLKETINLPNGEFLRTLRKFEEDNQVLINSLLDSLGLASVRGDTVVSGGIITNAGKLRLQNASVTNKISIPKFVVGDAAGVIYAIDGTETSLKNVVYEGNCSRPVIDQNNPTVVMFDVLVPASSGPYTMREAGLRDENGNLFAIGLTSVIEKPNPATANAKSVAVRLFIQLETKEQAYLLAGSSLAGGSSEAVTEHNQLIGRDAANCHPASAITGLDQLRSDFLGGLIAPAKVEEVAEVGDIIPNGTDFLRLQNGPKTKIFRLVPKFSGTIQSITLDGTTPKSIQISGNISRLYPVSLSDTGNWLGVVSTEDTSVDFPFPEINEFPEGGTVLVSVSSRPVASNQAQFLELMVNKNSSGAFAVQEIGRVGSEISCDLININEKFRVFDTRVGRKQVVVSYMLAAPRLYVYNSDVAPEPIRPTYDTIVGVGDSIAQGEYDLGNGIYDTPFRGVNFRTGAQYGTTLENIKTNIADFTSKAENRTLFIVRAGINDCNTYLSANGVNDGASGTVLAWDSMTNTQKQQAEDNMRAIVTELKKFGDVAIASLTYCDAKGQLSVMPDKGRNLHCGSWNDNLVIPLCQELTPEFFNSASGRPYFDYYTVVYNDPSILDADNLHFYNDRFFEHNEAGYPNSNGSYTIRRHTQDVLGQVTNFRPTPFDNTVYENRILMNIGRLATLRGRPSYQRDANKIEVDAIDQSFPNLNSWNGTTNVTIQANLPSLGSARGNLYTLPLPWDEGILDRNLVSSAIANTSSTTEPKFVITGLTGKKGKVRLIGLYVTEGGGSVYDSTLRTIFSVTDDLGTNSLERPNSINFVDVNISDCLCEFNFDCTNSGTLTIGFKRATGSSAGTLGGIELLIEK